MGPDPGYHVLMALPLPLRLAPLVLIMGAGCPFQRDLAGSGDTGSAAGGDSGETGEPNGLDPLHDGRYQGTMIVVGAPIDAPQDGESCSGPVVIDVRSGDEPEILGTATCSFGGWLSWLGEQRLDLRGDSQGAQGATGTVSVSFQGDAFEDDWTGAFGPEGLSGSFSGDRSWDIEGYGLKISFEGSFTAQREVGGDAPRLPPQ